MLYEILQNKSTELFTLQRNELSNFRNWLFSRRSLHVGYLSVVQRNASIIIMLFLFDFLFFLYATESWSVLTLLVVVTSSSGAGQLCDSSEVLAVVVLFTKATMVMERETLTRNVTMKPVKISNPKPFLAFHHEPPASEKNYENNAIDKLVHHARIQYWQVFVTIHLEQFYSLHTITFIILMHYCGGMT